MFDHFRSEKSALYRFRSKWIKTRKPETFFRPKVLQHMRNRVSAQDKMEELLEFIRSRGKISEDDAIVFCKQRFGVSPQTTYRYLNALERAGLIRVKPNEITPWQRKAKESVKSRQLRVSCRKFPAPSLALRLRVKRYHYYSLVDVLCLSLISQRAEDPF